MKQLVASFVLGSVLTVFGTAEAVDSPEETPFVPTPMEVVDPMLQLAEVRKGDVLYDLGSGDGRIVIRAAKLYGIRAVGVEMDPLLCGSVALGKGPPRRRDLRHQPPGRISRRRRVQNRPFPGNRHHTVHAPLVQRKDGTEIQ